MYYWKNHNLPVDFIISGQTESIRQSATTLVYKIIFPMIKNLSKNNEEIANDTFLYLLKQFKYFSPIKGQFHNFVYTVCKNFAGKQLKENKKEYIECQVSTKDEREIFLEDFYNRIRDLNGASILHSDKSYNYLFGLCKKIFSENETEFFMNYYFKEEQCSAPKYSKQKFYSLKKRMLNYINIRRK